jgi:hypothetical protein
VSGQSGRISEAGVWPRPRQVWSFAAILLVITPGIVIAAYRFAPKGSFFQ